MGAKVLKIPQFFVILPSELNCFMLLWYSLLS